ncbi:AI-2E family transporter [Sneathiella litorea]|nr:AI-2E family transporter [Sneathiella litorea]
MPKQKKIEPNASRVAEMHRGRIETAARVSVIFLALVTLVTALHFSRTILSPIFLAVVIGIMFGPIADRIERFRIPASRSAAIVVLLFIILISIAIAVFAAPLSTWIDQLPRIWARLRFELASWQDNLETVTELQAQLRSVTGQKDGETVVVEDGSAVQDAAVLAPTIAGQIVLFLASFYFFVAARHTLRRTLLSLPMSRRTRWHIARVFREIERKVSGYLLAITLVNLGMGLSVAIALWALDVPSPLLWGMLAAVLNYVIFIGPAVTFVILLGVGLTSSATLLGALTPALIFLGINLFEAQIVTPMVIGRRVTLNPFIVFLAIVFWIWLWGPLGGFIAVPSLLILFAIYNQMFAEPAVFYAKNTS